MSSNFKKFVFVLGRETVLCQAELESVLSRFGFCFSDLIVSDNILSIKLDSNPKDLIKILGGTIKIFEITDEGLKDEDIADKLLKNLVTFSKEEQKNKITFGLSSYTKAFSVLKTNKYGFEIKNKLKKTRISSRYIALKDKSDLSTIVSLSEKLEKKDMKQEFFKMLKTILWESLLLFPILKSGRSVTLTSRPLTNILVCFRQNWQEL